MKIFCPKCGTHLEGDIKFCFNCGFDVLSYINSQKSAAEQTEEKTELSAEEAAQISEVAETEPVTQQNNEEKTEIPEQQPQENASASEQNEAAEQVPAVVPVQTSETDKKKNKKKKKKLPFIIRFFRAILIIGAVLFLLWFGFGNMVTLYLHSEEVVETLNSGSLELAGTENAYTELPNYVKDMLDDEYLKNEQGPITKAVLPYIRAERISINGFFGMATVKYKITAPDIENWLLNLDPTLVTSENVLLSMMQQYIQNAPERSVEVSIEYDRKNIFSIDWRGNYYTREFADAVCGGFNSAYSTLFEQAMKEYMEAQGQ